ncbi:DEAD-box ATP-dependent RNA helicase 24 [Linum grandiflorum]
MSKRKFGFEGFGINRQTSYNFERSQAPQRLYVPPSSRQSHDNYEDTDIDNIDYDDTKETTSDGEHDESNNNNNAGGVEEDEVDPLDAFMEGIHEEMKAAPPPKAKEKVDKYRDDEEDDHMESFLRAKKDVGLTLAADALNAGYNSDEEVYAAAKAVDAGLLDYDSDDNPVVVDKKKIEPLVALDHSSVDYEPFSKDFYDEKESISGMSEQEVAEYRNALAIRVSGFDVPRPVKTFEDCGFSTQLMGAIAKQGYEKPTPIQCQALPIVLSGRDIIGIAKTGSGKTAAFILPMIVHIMDQPELRKEEGPIGVICAPTRELAHQIYLEAKKFAKPYGIRVSAVYGGMSKLEQFKELKAGCEMVVATPGRLIDMIKMKAANMFRATCLVLDEADRMFDLGFEPQIRSIVGQIRPDRQTLLFSATMPRKVETLAREILSDPVRVIVGEVGMANEDITQVVQVIPSDAEKLPWLLEKLPPMIDDGDVLVFASKKATVDEIESQLVKKEFKVAALHGDKDQSSRMEILQKFKSGVYHVLIATDVAARGLDIKSIKSVVNFDIAKDMDMHVHRIGRTGRAGDKDGIAYTLITQKEARFAGELANSLVAAGQNVSAELMDLAMKDGRFRSKRDARKGGGKKGKGRGGSGRGVRGVDFGLGIGYNSESTGPSSHDNRPSKSAGFSSARTGMMGQFKNNFVSASSNSQYGGFSNNGSSGRPALRGFVSGGSIGGDANRVQPSTSTLSGFVSAGSIPGDANRTPSASHNPSGNTNQKTPERPRTAETLRLGPLRTIVSSFSNGGLASSSATCLLPQPPMSSSSLRSSGSSSLSFHFQELAISPSVSQICCDFCSLPLLPVAIRPCRWLLQLLLQSLSLELVLDRFASKFCLMTLAAGPPRRIWCLWRILFVIFSSVILISNTVDSAGVSVPELHKSHRKHFSPLVSPAFVVAPAQPPDYDPLVTSGHPPTSSSLSKPLMKKSGASSSPPGVGLVALAPMQSNNSGLAQPPLSPDVSDCCGPELVVKRGVHGCHCVYPIKLDLLLSNVSQNHNWDLFLQELASELGLLVSQIELRNFYFLTLSRLNISMDIIPHSGNSFPASDAYKINSSLSLHKVRFDPNFVGDYQLLNLTWFEPPPPSPAPVAISSPPQAPAHPSSNSTSATISNRSKHSYTLLILIFVGSAVVIVTVLCMLLVCSRLSRRRKTEPPTEEPEKPRTTYAVPIAGSIPHPSSTRFLSYEELREATGNFSTASILGEGGFGRVFKGVLSDGTAVAIKRLTCGGQQGDKEFLVEVDMLSRLHHRNLVKLVGYYSSRDTSQNLLCYELVPNGSLEEWLHGPLGANSPLLWDTRMKIALDAARGLAYLHEDSQPSVIHRDFKASNILLENNFLAKVADFGLAKQAPEGRVNYLSTRVMGTFGYVAPEYAMTGHLLVKSDVYSYGVVLLELLTGRKPVDMSQPSGQENLVTWTRPILRDKDRLDELADPRLGGKYPKEDFVRVCTIAAACVAPEASQRPTMGEVVQSLKMVQRVTEYQDAAAAAAAASSARPNTRQSCTTFDSDGTSSMFSSGPFSGMSNFDNDRTAAFSEDLHEGR